MAGCRAGRDVSPDCSDFWTTYKGTRTCGYPPVPPLPATGRKPTPGKASPDATRNLHGRARPPISERTETIEYGETHEQTEPSRRHHRQCNVCRAASICDPLPKSGQP